MDTVSKWVPAEITYVTEDKVRGKLFLSLNKIVVFSVERVGRDREKKKCVGVEEGNKTSQKKMIRLGEMREREKE